jgi:hypothetical protein
MQRLINAIDKATRAGVYTLEETAQILQAIDQVGGIVQQYNAAKEAEKAGTTPPTPSIEDMKVVGAEELKSVE